MPRGISIQREASASPTLRKAFTTCSTLASWRRPISAVVNSGSNLIAPRLKDIFPFLSVPQDFRSFECDKLITAKYKCAHRLCASPRSEEHTSELQSPYVISYAV